MPSAILSAVPNTTSPSSQIKMCVELFLYSILGTDSVIVWGLVSQLKAYVEEWFTGSRITIVGVGELFDALAAFSVKLVLRNSSTNFLLLAVEIIEGLLAVQFLYTVNDQELNSKKAWK